MVIGIYANLARDIDGNNAQAIANAFLREGISICLDKSLDFLQIDAPLYTIDKLVKECDIIVTLGGDGTILGIAEQCALNNCKIYALNLGNLGFYTEPFDKECNKIINSIKSGKPLLYDKRSLLSINFCGQTYYALNEVVVARGARTKLVKLEVSINGNKLGRYMADGIILSTSSGSTAYSLSAGGPIVIPDVPAFVVTPLAPHSLQARPYIISSDSTIKIELFSNEQPAHIHVDGKEIGLMSPNDNITIEKSSKYIEFIRFEDYDYYSRLVEKINKLGIAFK